MMSEYHVENREINTDDGRIDLLLIGGDFWKGFKKFWWLCICFAVIFSAVFFMREKQNYVPMYKAESSFTVSLKQAENYGESNTSYSFYYNSATASQMAKTFPYILQSDILTGIIEEELGVGGLNGSINASAVENSNLFTISVISNNPEDALTILESVIENYPAVARYVVGDTEFNVIEPATLPTQPFNLPTYRSQVCRGAILGLLLGFCVILLYALSRRTIRKPEDCKNKLNISSMGEIPVVHFKQRNKKIDQTLSVNNSKASYAFKESMRTLTMRIAKEMDENGAKTLMVTSTVPQEGKTTTAVNIAYCLAKRGKRVILVDANLQKPEIRKLITEVDEDRELSALIGNKGALNYYLCKSKEGKIYVLGNVKPAKRASHLLGSLKMKDLINRLAENSDYVVIDTASMTAAADCVAMAEYVDMALYVIKQDEVKVWDIMDGISVLGSSSIQICGCVLNQVRSGIEGYGYGYGKYGYGRYGRYSYGYGYGYGKYGYGKYGYGYGSKDSSKNDKQRN